MTVTFQKATKKQARLRMAIDGPSGSGKTFTALTFATALAAFRGGRVAVIDTERGSASKYADMFDFDVLELGSYPPSAYVEGIKAAESAGYAVIVIDSLSHAWEGQGGVLEMHDQATARNRGNSYTAWRFVTPEHQSLVDAMLQSGCDVIATMRSKIEYVQTEENGKTTVKKMGMAPIQRQGMEYEFDVVADIDIDHKMVVSKSRCFAVADDVATKPGPKWLTPVIAWLTDGAPVPAPKIEIVAVTDQPPAPHSPVAPKGTCWTDDTALANKFMAKAINSTGLSGSQIYEALGVTKLTDWRHDMDDAKARIEWWIAREQEREAEAALDEEDREHEAEADMEDAERAAAEEDAAAEAEALAEYEARQEPLM